MPDETPNDKTDPELDLSSLSVGFVEYIGRCASEHYSALGLGKAPEERK